MANSVNLNKQKHGLVLQTEAIAPSADGTVLAATKTLKNTDSGKTFFCDLSSGTAAFQLPAPEAGLHFTWVVTTVGGGKDFAVFTSAAAVDIWGIGLEAGILDISLQAGRSTLQLDHSVAAVAIGDRLSLVSDGSHWYIRDLTVTTATTIVAATGLSVTAAA